MAFFGAFQMALQMGAFYVCRVERKWGVERSVWLASSLALIVIMYRAKQDWLVAVSPIFSLYKWEKGGSFLFPKKGETQVSRYGKKAMPSFLLFFFPITIFSSAVFCSLDACLLRLLLRRRGTGRLSMPKARLEE